MPGRRVYVRPWRLACWDAGCRPSARAPCHHAPGMGAQHSERGSGPQRMGHGVGHGGLRWGRHRHRYRLMPREGRPRSII